MVMALSPVPLSRARFEPYGDVIETAKMRRTAMNSARFERFDDQCTIDVAGDGRIAVSIARCRVPTTMPYRFDTVERHPLGSQAFMPLSRAKMIVVVAPACEEVDPADLRAFVTNGRQGINYHRGTWHMPLIAFEAGQEFLVIDRAADQPNCEEQVLDEPVLLEAD
jgi:ureidoglycolate lyase